jgi:hypothetical protein
MSSFRQGWPSGLQTGRTPPASQKGCSCFSLRCRRTEWAWSCLAPHSPLSTEGSAAVFWCGGRRLSRPRRQAIKNLELLRGLPRLRSGRLRVLLAAHRSAAGAWGGRVRCSSDAALGRQRLEGEACGGDWNGFWRGRHSYHASLAGLQVSNSLGIMLANQQ